MNWKELSLIKKILIGSAILAAAMIAPELMLIIDIGGIDLAFGALFLYYKPVFTWIKDKKQMVNEELKIAKNIIITSALSRPRIFTLNTAFCSAVILTTGSLLFSFSFLLPALFISGASV